MSDATVEVGSHDLSAEDVKNALEQLPDSPTDEAAQSGDVVIVGDGFERNDGVNVIEVGGAGHVQHCVSASDLRERAEDALGPEPGFYVRAASESGNYGFEIPLSESDEFVIEYNGRASHIDPHGAAWNTDVDVSDMKNNGHGGAKQDGLDGYAVVDTVEIIERE